MRYHDLRQGHKSLGIWELVREFPVRNGVEEVIVVDLDGLFVSGGSGGRGEEAVKVEIRPFEPGSLDHAVGPSVAVDKLEDSRLVAEDDVEEGFGADGEVAGQESLHAYVHVVNCYPGISAGIRGRLTLWRIVDGLRRQLTA